MANGSESANPIDDHLPLPDPAVILQQTDWTALDHAVGCADDIPFALSKLTDQDPDVRAEALRYLERINHQNSIYSATAPVALYLAGILRDPHTGPAVNARYPTWRTEYRCLRAVLLEWLGDMAYDVSDATLLLAGAHGFVVGPECNAMRAARPAIFSAVVQFLEDDDPDVRRSAVLAAAQLLDARELADHRAGLLGQLKDVLTKSSDSIQRARAQRALLGWDLNPAVLDEPATSTPPF